MWTLYQPLSKQNYTLFCLLLELPTLPNEIINVLPMILYLCWDSGWMHVTSVRVQGARWMEPCYDVFYLERLNDKAKNKLLISHSQMVKCPYEKMDIDVASFLVMAITIISDGHPSHQISASFAQTGGSADSRNVLCAPRCSSTSRLRCSLSCIPCFSDSPSCHQSLLNGHRHNEVDILGYLDVCF